MSKNPANMDKLVKLGKICTDEETRTSQPTENDKIEEICPNFTMKISITK